MMYAADFRRTAYDAVEGNWGKAIGTYVVGALLGVGTTAGAGFSMEFDFGDYATVMERADSEEVAMVLLGLLGGSILFSVMISLFHFIVGGAATLGYVKFNFNLLDKNGEAKFSDLFSQFHRLGTGIAMQLLRGIYTFLWSLLFVIPGIIKSYSYAMTPYILLENPNMSANEAITESRKLMDGNKWRLFCLEISFIGWVFVCLLTCGIGYFWLFPYQEASFAAFYREIKREKYGDPVEAEPIVEGTSYEEMVNDRYREPEYRDVTFYEVPEEKNENTDEN